ncbi:IDEAL domain-containing protein [Paenibacillus sp. NPDC056579]|uniref:IDEAL domain-containing protein n=1 Tax=unclassified Paenibacillus TaxID=185978 RepID=UPI001EF75BE6|nr:IDEAL domain-containing protein [Paenibacillus sp. H1-7]ULL15585.1 IDEAL domain-containing protein [Paenibacillus sp. H1-7]
MGKMNVSNDMMLSLFAEMVLDEAVRKYREQYLYREIDLALAKGDEVSFLALTTELKSLHSNGT